MGWERATAALPNGVGIAHASHLCARRWTPRPLGDACGKRMAKCLWTNRMTNGAPTMKRSVGIQVSLAMCDEEHWGEQKTSTPASILSTTGAASSLLRHRCLFLWPGRFFPRNTKPDNSHSVKGWIRTNTRGAMSPSVLTHPSDIFPGLRHIFQWQAFEIQHQGSWIRDSGARILDPESKM